MRKDCKNIIGNKYNKLTVLSFSHYHKQPNGDNKEYYVCLCDCGKQKIVRKDMLIYGGVKSCGCLLYEKSKENNKKHGLYKSRIYQIYYGMLQRCYNTKNIKYDVYGGRGISVCDNWKNDFKNFYVWASNNGYNENLTLDRIDNDGNYCPENCRWTSKAVQSANRRPKSNSYGVCYCKKIKRYRSRICINNKTVFNKYYKTLEDALKARENFIIENNLPNGYARL